MINLFHKKEVVTFFFLKFRKFATKEVVLCDVNEMTQKELEKALDNLAERWSKEPFLSNDYNEGKRYGELRGALRVRFGVSKVIEPINENRGYFVVLSS